MPNRGGAHSTTTHTQKLPTSMKKIISLLAIGITMATFAAEPAAPEALNTICPISGKPANPAITAVYEGKSYAFAEEACRTKWQADRAASLYQQIGGQPAINAAVDLFYTKVLV